jgi:hypothetical protein
MAFTQLVAQANRTGSFTSPSLTIANGAVQVRIRLTSSSWPTATANSMAWAIDRSDDSGASWREITDGVTAEGARNGKDGSMPEVMLAASPNPQTGLIQPWPAHLLRARCRITGTLRFGLEAEII